MNGTDMSIYKIMKTSILHNVMKPLDNPNAFYIDRGHDILESVYGLKHEIKDVILNCVSLMTDMTDVVNKSVIYISQLNMFLLEWHVLFFKSNGIPIYVEHIHIHTDKFNNDLNNIIHEMDLIIGYIEEEL